VEPTTSVAVVPSCVSSLSGLRDEVWRLFSGERGFSGGVAVGVSRCWQAITVQRWRGSSERVEMRGGRLAVTDAARDAIRRLCRDAGRQVLLLSWPGGAVCLPFAVYTDGV
jgi:hypothetical protein